MNTISTVPNRLELHIDPDDADQAFVAGVQFARALAGVDGGGFMVALGEQAALVQATIATVGFSATVARLASQGLPEPGRGMSAFLVALVLLAGGGLYFRSRR